MIVELLKEAINEKIYNTHKEDVRLKEVGVKLNVVFNEMEDDIYEIIIEDTNGNKVTYKTDSDLKVFSVKGDAAPLLNDLIQELFISGIIKK